MLLACNCPALGWDLGLHPKQLHAAFWRDNNSKYMRLDMQVVGFLLIVSTITIIRNASTSYAGQKPNVWAGIPTWLVLAAWLLVASRRANTYREHRTMLVMVFKSMLALAVLHLTNDGGRLVGSSRTEHSSTVLLVQATSLHGLVHLPALCVGLPLPFWLQLGWMLARTTMFCLGRASRELVNKANTLAYTQELSAFNSLWMRVVQSGSHHMVMSPDAALHHHSSAMTVTLVTMHLSAAALSMYLAYITQWVQVRSWLRQQAGYSNQPGQQLQQQQQRPRLPVCPTEVGGVLLTPRQLQDMVCSHAATLLLDGRGVLGRASMVLLHACVVNVLLLLVLLLSHLLVLWVGPRVMPGPVFRMFYPLTSKLGGGVCMPEDEHLGGFWGRLLVLLGA